MKTFNSNLMTLAVAVKPFAANAAEPFEPATKLRPNMTLALYPEGQKVNKGIEENGKTITLGPGESNKIAEPEEMKASGTMSKVGDNARIDIYLPKKPNGQMIVVCPGGGYKNLSTFNEGAYVADWLVKRGISVCVVKYRLPNGHWNVPLNDVQNAFRYCRAHAQEWGVNQIGVMGFSAGGHLAASASTLFVDTVTRPDCSHLPCNHHGPVPDPQGHSRQSHRQGIQMAGREPSCQGLLGEKGEVRGTDVSLFSSEQCLCRHSSYIPRAQHG